MQYAYEGSQGWQRTAAVTSFVEELEAAKEFYGRAFDLSAHFADDDSAVFRFRDTLIKLMTTTAAHALTEPAPIAHPPAGVARAVPPPPGGLKWALSFRS